MLGGFTLIEFGMLGLLGLGCIVLARIDKRYLTMPWLSMGASAMMLLADWLRYLWLEPEVSLPVVQFAWLTIGFGLLYVLGSYSCLWRSGRESVWAWLSSIAAVVFMFVAWVGGPAMDRLVDAGRGVDWIDGAAGPAGGVRARPHTKRRGGARRTVAWRRGAAHADRLARV